MTVPGGVAGDPAGGGRAAGRGSGLRHINTLHEL